ncbi:MAG: DUF3821 domain-containing protein [Methanomicrobiales archaeon]|nr:DUF3821 domain-containing protein [Methanomicrobiales archaeon]
MSRKSYYGMLLLAVICLCTGVQAAINTIPAGGTVFIGEEGLDLTAAGIDSNTQLAYWQPGNSLSNAPDYVLLVGNAINFYVNPQIFTERTGPWYRMSDQTVVLYVQDPSLAIRFYDVDTGRDATGLRVVAGEQMQFRIDNNLYPMMGRPGVAGAPVSIHVRDPNGVEYTSLINQAGVSTSLLDIPVNSGSYFTGPIWYINAPYITGIYDIWAVCNANRMRDNYEVVGKTITAVLHQPIGGGAITITIVTPTTTTPTTTTTPVPTTPVPTTTTPIPTTTVPPTTPPPSTSIPPTTTVPPTTTTPGFGALAALAAGILALIVLRKSH